MMISNDQLNLFLKSYDDELYRELEPILEKIRLKSKALASNLQECFISMAATTRYLRAANGESVGMKDSDLLPEEFMPFRKYVRLLRSCTILLGNEISKEFKELYMDFTFGKRLELARDYGTGENQKEKI